MNSKYASQLVGFKPDYSPALPYVFVIKHGNGRKITKWNDASHDLPHGEFRLNQPLHLHTKEDFTAAANAWHRMMHAANWQSNDWSRYPTYELHVASGLGTSSRTLVEKFDYKFARDLEDQEFAFHINDAIREYETGAN